MVEAQALLMFGDGLQALYYDEKNTYVNREGNKVRPILVVPSEELRDKYNLSDEDLNIETGDSISLGIFTWTLPLYPRCPGHPGAHLAWTCQLSLLLLLWMARVKTLFLSIYPFF